MAEMARPVASAMRFGRSVWAWPIAAALLAAWPVWRSLFPETPDLGLPPVRAEVALAAAQVVLCGVWIGQYRHRTAAFHLPLFVIGLAVIVGLMAGARGDDRGVDLAALAICWLVTTLLFAGAVLLEGQRAFAAVRGGAVPPVSLFLRVHERVGYWLAALALIAAGVWGTPAGFLLAALAIASPGAIVSWAALCDTARNVLARRRAHVADLASLPGLANHKRIVFADANILIATWPKVVSIMPAGDVKPGDIVAVAAALLADDDGPWGHAVQDFGVSHRVRVPDLKLLDSRAPGVRRGKLPDRRIVEVGTVEDCVIDSDVLALFAEGIARARDLHRTVLAVMEAEPTPQLLGLLTLAKVARPGAAEAVRSLRKSGYDLALMSGDVGMEDREALRVLEIDAATEAQPAIAIVPPGAAPPDFASVTIRFGGRAGTASGQEADIVIARDDPRTLVDLVRFGRDFRTRVPIAITLASLPGLALLSAVFLSLPISPFLVTGVAVVGVVIATAAPQVLRLSPTMANEVDEE
jgi:hypothetical protein